MKNAPSMTRKVVTSLLPLTLLLSLAASARAAKAPVTIRVVDGSTGRAIFARAVLRDGQGKTVLSTGYETLDGHVVFPEGWKLSLEEGTYSLVVDSGYEHVPHEEIWTVTGPEEKTVRLERWISLEGWYAGGDHNHLNRDGSEDKNYGGASVTMEFAASLMASRGWDYYACGGGGAWIVDGDGACDADDGDNERFQRGWETEPAAARWNERYGDRCFLWWNNEHVKGRFGHLWLLGRSSRKGVPYPWTEKDASAFWDFYDIHWDPWQKDRNGPIGPYASDRWPIPPTHDCIASWHEHGLVSIYAHPTRSWRSGGVHWSNVAAAFPFDLLAGAPVGGLVIMGDHHDHRDDQSLWFAALHEGFRVAGIAENDTVFGRPRIREHPFVTYTRVPDMGDRFDLGKLAGALAAGRNFVSSGAFSTFRVDGRHQIGDVVRADGGELTVEVDARASSDPEDAIEAVEVIANGEVRARPEEARGKRVYRGTHRLDAHGVRWLIVKVLCRKRGVAAITNPIYIRGPGEPDDPEPLGATVSGTVTLGGEGVPAAIAVLHRGEEVRKGKAAADGSYRLESVPLASRLEFSRGDSKAVKSIFLDDPDYRRIHREIYSLRYTGAPGSLAGCFPPDVFEKLGDFAEHVVIDVELEEEE